MSDLDKAAGRIIKATKAGNYSLDPTEQSVIDKQQRGDRLSASEMIRIFEIIDKLEEKKHESD
jgi:hypothetical protein